jgi:hypothetical protein
MPRLNRTQAGAALAELGPADFPDDTSGELTERQYASFVTTGRAAGRPSLTSAGVHSPQITVRLPEPTNSRLEGYAKHTGRRRSQIIRDALDNYLPA